MKNIQKIRQTTLATLLLVLFCCACSSKEGAFSEEEEGVRVPILLSLSEGPGTDYTTAPESVSEVSSQIEAEPISENQLSKRIAERTGMRGIVIGEVVCTKRIGPETKTSWNTTGGVGASLTAGDSIGFFMRRTDGVADTSIDRNNVQYTVSTTAATSALTTTVVPQLYFPYSTANKINLYAYYPYLASSTTIGSIPYAIPTDQSTAAALAAADVLYSRNIAGLDKTTPNVSMTFSHAMVLVTFSIQSALLSKNLTKVQLSGTDLTSGGSLDLDGGVVTPNATTFSPYATVNYTLSDTPVYVDFIINRATVGLNLTGTELMVSFTINGVVSTSAFGANTTFTAGNRYVYPVTVIE